MKENQGEHPQGDLGQIILFIVFMLVWIGDSFIFKWSTFLASQVSLPLRLILAAGIIILAFILIQAGHRVVPNHQPVAKLVTDGVFRYVRHPLYLGTILFYVGLTLATLSLFSAAVLILLFIFYNYIAGYEEKVLEKKFGEDYRRYEHITARWIPGLLKKN